RKIRILTSYSRYRRKLSDSSGNRWCENNDIYFKKGHGREGRRIDENRTLYCRTKYGFVIFSEGIFHPFNLHTSYREIESFNKQKYDESKDRKIIYTLNEYL